MKSSIFYPLSLAAAVTLATITQPTITALASTGSPVVLGVAAERPSPRYNYIQSAEIGVNPSDLGSSYVLSVTGFPSVTRTTGTLTVYKQNSSGSYTKIDSESIDESGSSFTKYGTLASSGPGKYKIQFTGRVYTPEGSESITISGYDSY